MSGGVSLLVFVAKVSSPAGYFFRSPYGILSLIIKETLDFLISLDDFSVLNQA
jgi:hypothetical protein